MKEQFTVTAVCLFCGSPLQDEEGKEFQSGDMIKCRDCGELSDYDSVVEVAIEKGTEMVADEVTTELSKALGKAFK